jgi:hypothetical protein
VPVQAAAMKPAPAGLPVAAEARPAPPSSILIYYVLGGAAAGLALLGLVAFWWQGKRQAP